MKFVIFHGSYGSPNDNWFLQLKEKLELLGQEVIIPKFPVDNWNEITKNGPSVEPKHQNLRNWLNEFEKIKTKLRKDEKICFIGHSLGPVFILHIVEKFNIQLDCAIFVSPFLRDLHKDWQFYIVNKTFYKIDFDFEKLKKLIPVSYVLYSDNDPYVDPEIAKEFASKLDSSTIMVKKAGHLNSEVNLNEFPLVLELCKTRIDFNLYQRFIGYKHGMTSAEYIQANKDQMILHPVSDLKGEGGFHFRNLQKRGFCTLLTGLKIWDTQSEYMNDCREAAKRIKDLTRVFVVSSKDDLKRSALMEQIKLDLNAGIKIYLIDAKKVKKITDEPDFGIWDDDYVCIVSPNKFGDVDDLKLSSKKKDIEEAKRVEKEILKHAIRILTLKDIKQF